MNKIKERVLEILQNTNLMFLGTHDEKGSWVSPVSFIFDENFFIYWQSSPRTRHSKAISQNKKASGSIVLHDGFYGNMPELAIQFDGEVDVINGERDDLSLKNFEKRKYKERGKEIPEDLKCLREGNFWYCLKPNKIELIDFENVKYEKQVLIIKNE
jgi:uncharacterized protein YhbP (UPF0306 family)